MTRILTDAQRATIRERMERARDRTPAQAPARLARSTAPLSFAQERMWFLDELEPESPAYVEHVLLRMVGPLAVEALRGALQRVVDRHDALRTRFVHRGSGVVQEVCSGVAPAWAEVDLADDAERELRRQATAEARRPFDLGVAPLLRATLFRLGPADHALLLVNHHIISDAWSRGILLRELCAAYAEATGGPVAALPALPAQVGDHAVWTRERADRGDLEPHLAAWRRQLAGPPTLLDLPTDRPRPRVQTHRGGVHAFEVPARLAAAADERARAARATPFMVLLAAFDVVLAHASGVDDLWVGTVTAGRDHRAFEDVVGCLMNTLVVRASLAGDPTFSEVVDRVRAATEHALTHAAVSFEQLVADLRPARDPGRSALFQVLFTLQNAPTGALDLPGLEVTALQLDAGTSRLDLTLELVPREGGGYTGRLEYNADLFDASTAERLAERYVAVLSVALAAPSTRLSDLPRFGPAEAASVERFSRPDVALAGSSGPFVDRFAAQVARTPDAVALVGAGRAWTYGELDRWSTDLARRVPSGARVAVCLDHGPTLVATLIAVWKAGSSYVPLDPEHPPDRLRLVIEDAGAAAVLTSGALTGRVPATKAPLLRMDAPTAPGPAAAPARDDAGEAYVFYTSGSTGVPKGVVVDHPNLASFFDAMDQRLGDETGVWLALTSFAFDISILELLWPLTRGFRVVAPTAGDIEAVEGGGVEVRPLDFGLFFFASTDTDRADPYGLLLESARFADDHGLCSVWTPERHFHAFGGSFPNPAVVGAAVAAVTRRIAIRAGSVVLPLHHPARVAEEWAVVDQLSGGRVGVSVASGWHADDFALAPAAWATRRETLQAHLRTVRQLWRGEAVQFPNGVGAPIEVRTHPRPVQPELPVWVTSSGDPATFALAGTLGAGLLTHLLGQSVDGVAANIATYRERWREAGHPGHGHVALMLHTYLGEDLQQARDEVREPFCAYLRSSVGLIRNLARSVGVDLDAAEFGEDDLQALLDHAFDRYADDAALFGTVDSCAALVDRLRTIGVDEVACLVDFGVPRARVLDALPRLVELHRRANRRRGPDAHPLFRLIEAHGVTHFQCTPALARIVTADRAAFGTVHTLLVGGEALPVDLAAVLARSVPRVLNLYGPTEATVWASSAAVRPGDDRVTIGRPLGNSRLYVLDAAGRPCPVGVPGELYLGGQGVARGYHAREDLTAQRFPSDPERGRLFRTGDLGRWLADGTVEFLGRDDRQVKLRGFRIELGEIEAQLRRHPGVTDAVVEVRGPDDDRRLIAWVVGLDAVHPNDLRAHLRAHLPDYMVPAQFVALDRVPLNPNGKLDRAALPDPATPQGAHRVYVAPGSPLEQSLAEVWAEVLGVGRVGRDDDFFELGGHSLLAVQIVARIRASVGIGLSLRDFMQTPTIAACAARIRPNDAQRSA